MGAALLGSARKSGTTWSPTFQEGHATDVFSPPELATMVPVSVEPVLSRLAVSFQKRGSHVPRPMAVVRRARSRPRPFRPRPGEAQVRAGHGPPGPPRLYTH